MRLLKQLTLLTLTMAFLAQAAQAQLARKRFSTQDEGLPSESGTAFDNTVEKMGIKVRRIAIIPNRMPLFLTEADMWRKYNWQVLAGMFEDRGFDVADYDSTGEAFTRSNLPMEDTGASEEKFSRMAEILQADLLVMPYYGTSFQSKNILVANIPSYIALVTLQIYSPKENKFIYRSDQTGKRSIFMGYSMLGLLVSLPMPATTGGTEATVDPSTGSFTAGTAATVNPAKILLPLLGVVMDLGLAMIPPKRHWQMAFLKADRSALQPFFSAFPGPMGTKTKKKKKVVAKPAAEEEASEEEEAPVKSTPAKRAPAKAAPAKKAPPSEEDDLGLGVDE